MFTRAVSCLGKATIFSNRILVTAYKIETPMYNVCHPAVGLPTIPNPQSPNPLRCTVSSHNFNLPKIKLRVSNPRTIAYFHFESSDLPGAGPIFPD